MNTLRRRRAGRTAAAIAALLVAALGAPPAQAQLYGWGCQDAAWSNAACWVPAGIPGAADAAWVGLYAGGATRMRIDGSGGDWLLGTLVVDSARSSSAVIQTGGYLKASQQLVTSDGWFFLSDVGVSVIDKLVVSSGALYGQSGGLLFVNTAWIQGGRANMLMNGGQARMESLRLGNAGAGLFDLRNGSLETGQLSIDGGQFKQSGGSHSVRSALVVGQPNAPASQYLLTAGSLSTAQTRSGGGAAPLFTQSGGTHSTQHLSLGDERSEPGRYELSGGELHTSRASIGLTGTSSFVHSAGKHFSRDLFVGVNGRYELNDGRVEATSMRNEGGFVQSGGVLQASLGNSGHAQLLGGSMSGRLVNEAAGTADLGNGYQLGDGVLNRGLLTVRSTATFSGPVDLQAGSAIHVEADGHAIFEAAVAVRNGAALTGPGTLHFNAGLAVGDSPGSAHMSGGTTFGAGNLYQAEIGGATNVDHYRVDGLLTVGGTLRIESYGNFIGSAGERFDLFDWGTLQGRFASIDASALQLAPDTALDLSSLYVDGSIAVRAVPEPATLALWLAGLVLLGRRLLEGAPCPTA